jgi:hypothetical protein
MKTHNENMRVKTTTERIGTLDVKIALAFIFLAAFLFFMAVNEAKGQKKRGLQ